jgi:hypothetical protein
MEGGLRPRRFSRLGAQGMHCLMGHRKPIGPIPNPNLSFRLSFFKIRQFCLHVGGKGLFVGGSLKNRGWFSIQP